MDRYNPTEYPARVPFPAGIISYRTASDGGKGDLHMWAIANCLEAHEITCYCGLMVRTENWQEEWYGKMYQAKFAIIMTSDKYWERGSPCTAEVTAILQRGIPIFSLRIDDSCHTCMRGNFLGDSVEQITKAGFLKAKLGSLNCFPPPHKPLFQVRGPACLRTAFVQTRACILPVSSPIPYRYHRGFRKCVDRVCSGTPAAPVRVPRQAPASDRPPPPCLARPSSKRTSPSSSG
jgi:hypothetical protein